MIKRRARYWFSGALLLNLLLPLHAYASKGGAPLTALFWPVVNFVLFCGMVVFLYQKKIAPLLFQRSKNVAESLNKAANKLISAEEGLIAHRERLKTIDRETSVLAVSYEKEGKQMGENILRHARLAARQISEDTKSQVERELQQAINVLRDEAVAHAMKQVREKLDSELSADDDQALRRKVLTDAFPQ